MKSKLKKLKRNLKRAPLISHVLKAMNRDFPPPTSSERAATDELRAEIRRLPRLAPGRTDAENEWTENRRELRSMILCEDPRRFLRWNVVTTTMVVGDTPFAREELGALRKSENWESRYKASVGEPDAPQPQNQDILHPGIWNNAHHAYHLLQFEEKTGVRVDSLPFAMEFGGGYGNMCRLFHSLGFHGKYVIFDLDEFSALQRFFLKMLNIGVAAPDQNGAADSSVACVSDFDQASRNTARAADGLFLATWSISETPLELRRKFFESFNDFAYYLITFQNAFCEVDNVKYFTDFANQRSGFDWNLWEIPHLKNNFYLIGKRK